MIDVAPDASAAGCNGASRRIDSRVFDGCEIDHETVIANSKSACVVAPPADRDEELVVASEIYAPDDVCDIRAPRDKARFLMNHSVVDLASFIVICVARLDDSASEALF
jgi:hypothetical protein